MTVLSKYPAFKHILSFGPMKKAFLLLASAVGGSYMLYSLFETREHTSALTTTAVPTYICVPPKVQGSYIDEFNGSHRIRNEAPYQYWTLLNGAESGDISRRYDAIKKLAEITNFDDAEYLAIAQSCNPETTVGLARTYSASSRFFLPPSKLLFLNKEPLEYKLYYLLNSLPQSDASECVQYFRKCAFGMQKLNYNDAALNLHDAFDVLDDFDYYHKKPHLGARIKFYLDALLAHSTIAAHRHSMIKNGIFPILHEINHEIGDDLQVKSIVAQIIANIALDQSLHSHIHATGWIGILASWSRSSNVQLSFPAIKALANMDRIYENECVFSDGLYLLHPQFREDRQSTVVDVVFIHGIMGGVFRTWRQHDSKQIKGAPPKGKKTNVDGGNDVDIERKTDSSEYTYCWPKDWLAKEFPNFRLIGIDYNSHVSEWKTKCPYEKEKRELKARSKDTLKKLVDAGVGKRPVIFVAHSMGGLLVEQMLLEADASDDASMKSLSANTIAAVFYSVPHKGVEVASLGHHMNFLFKPSIEIKQLKKGSVELMKMHDNFKQLVEEKNIRCVSFGETLKSKLGLHMNAVLVSRDSSDPGFGQFHELEADHLNTCKPEDQNSPSYKLLVTFFHSVLQSMEVTEESYARDDVFNPLF